MRSIFGEKIESISPRESNERLLYKQASETVIRDILECLPHSSMTVEQIAYAAGQAIDTFTSILLHAREHLICFEHNPSAQVDRFISQLFRSALLATPFPIFSPCCPDYEGTSYRLGDGFSETAKRAIDAYAQYSQLFHLHGIPTRLHIHLADVEADDETVLTATQESSTSFRIKLGKTALAIQEYIRTQDKGDSIYFSSMSSFLRNRGVSYSEEVSQLTTLIAESQQRTIVSVRLRLQQERERNGDYSNDSFINPLVVASNELAGYGVYGRAVAGSAFIASPDAKSAIPAYNFFTSAGTYNATAYIKRGEGKRI